MNVQKCLVSLLVLGGVQQVLADGLFFSEMNEPTSSSGNRKVIEIYNGTAATVDLSTVQIAKGTNGAPYSLPGLVLGPGNLCPGDTWVVANTTTDVPNVDQVDTGSVFQFNGDDALGLLVGFVR